MKEKAYLEKLKVIINDYSDANIVIPKYQAVMIIAIFPEITYLGFVLSKMKFT